MRRISILFFVICSCFACYGQISKGTIAITSDFSFTANDDSRVTQSRFQTDEKLTAFSISPTFQYFIKDDLSISLGLGYRRETVDTEVFNNATDVTTLDIVQSNSFVSSLQLRKYKMFSTSFGLFGAFKATYETGESDTMSSTTLTNLISDVRAWSLGLSPGVIFFLSDRFSIEASIGLIGYEYRKIDPQESINVSTTKRFNSSLTTSSFNFGMQFYLKR